MIDGLYICVLFQANYQAIREAYQTLQELRETGPEATLREAQTHNVGRLEGKVSIEIVMLTLYLQALCPAALRKQVSTYAKENEELRNQADALKEEVATLSENQEGGNDIAQPMRETASGREDETMDMSTDNNGTSRGSTSKAEASLRILREDEALLREENEELKAKVQELGEEVVALTEDAQQLKKEKKSLKKQWEADIERLENNLKHRWEKERQKLLAENEEMASRCE
jgi:cell division protein FtsB